MEEALGSVISDGINNVLHESWSNTRELALAEGKWTKSGKRINYDYSFKGHLSSSIRYNGMKHPDNSTLQEFSNTHLNDATAEYRFFEAWFLYLSRTGEFNAVFSQASKKFTDLAKTHKTGIFSHDELAQCFAGIGNYTRVTQFAMGLLTKAVVLTDPGRQSVPFSSVANLLNLAVKVVNVRKEMYDSAKKRKKEDEGHHFQVRNWASIVAYLGILLQAMTRLDKKILHGNPILWADGYIW